MVGFCFGEHFGQCLAHFIMGSSFIAYAFIMLIMLRLGAGWLSRRKCSQEYIDCWVIMIWGIVNFFTEVSGWSTACLGCPIQATANSAADVRSDLSMTSSAHRGIGRTKICNMSVSDYSGGAGAHLGFYSGERTSATWSQV